MGDGRAESWDDSESLARVSHLRREVEERRVSGTGILGANLLAVTWHAARPISQHRLRVAEGTNGPKPQVDAAWGLLCILVVLMTVCVRFLFARWGGVKPSPSYTRGVRTCFSQVAWCEGNNCAHDAE